MLNPTGGQAPARIVVSSEDYRKMGLPLAIQWGHAVAQLVEALSYKPEDRGFDSRRCHWNFSLT